MSSSKISVEYVGSLAGHNGWVTSLAVGVDSNSKPLLVSGSRDKSVIVWKLNLDAPEEITNVDKPEEIVDYKVGKPLKALKGHSHFVSGLSMARDSKHVISSSWDKTMRLWDLTTMTTKQLFAAHEKDVLVTTFTQDNRMILSGGMDKKLKVSNTKGVVKHTVENFSGWVSSVAHVNQGKGSLFAVGSWDNKVRLYDNDFKFIRGIDSSIDSAVVSMASDDTGEILIVGHKNGLVNIWNLASDSSSQDTQIKKIDINADLNAICYDNQYLSFITLATSKGISVRDINGTQEVYGKTYGNNNACLSIAFDQSKQFLFAGFSDGIIRVYKFSEEK